MRKEKNRGREERQLNGLSSHRGVILIKPCSSTSLSLQFIFKKVRQEGLHRNQKKPGAGFRFLSNDTIRFSKENKGC